MGFARPRLVGTLPDVNRHLRDGVVPVAKSVPLRALGLRAAGHVRRASAHHGRAWLLDPRDQLPPLPAVPPRLAHETGLLPGPPPTLTSTRAIAAAPDQATPRIATSPRSTFSPAPGSVIKARTRCSVTGSLTTRPSRCHS